MQESKCWGRENTDTKKLRIESRKTWSIHPRKIKDKREYIAAMSGGRLRDIVGIASRSTILCVFLNEIAK